MWRRVCCPNVREVTELDTHVLSPHAALKVLPCLWSMPRHEIAALPIQLTLSRMTAQGVNGGVSCLPPRCQSSEKSARMRMLAQAGVGRWDLHTGVVPSHLDRLEVSRFANNRSGSQSP